MDGLAPYSSADRDWNNPRLRQLGEKFAAQAYNLADELHSCGADPEQMLLPWRQRRARPFRLEVQPELLDTVAAVLLSCHDRGSAADLAAVGRSRALKP